MREGNVSVFAFDHMSTSFGTPSKEAATAVRGRLETADFTVVV